MEICDILWNQLTLAQNSILTWLVVGLASAIGIIELNFSRVPDKDYKKKIVLFLILSFIFFFSFEMILNHMGDVFWYRNELEKSTDFIRPPSMEKPSDTARLMENLITTFLGIGPIRYLIYLGFIFLFYWFFLKQTPDKYNEKKETNTGQDRSNIFLEKNPHCHWYFTYSIDC